LPIRLDWELPNESPFRGGFKMLGRRTPFEDDLVGKRTAKRVFIWPFAHFALTWSEDDGRTGFPALHLAPGHFKATLTLPFLKRLPSFSRAVAKRVSRLGQQ
jgi:hypothetical protein